MFCGTGREGRVMAFIIPFEDVGLGNPLAT